MTDSEARRRIDLLRDHLRKTITRLDNMEKALQELGLVWIPAQDGHWGFDPKYPGTEKKEETCD